MADGYARVTGRVGVCEGPSGGGATYILPGLVEANESSVPILAINTDVSVSSRNRFTLTELDQGALMKPLTKWNAVLDRSADIPRSFRAAFDAMTSGRPGAAHIALPFDVQNGPVERTEVWADPTLGTFPSRRVAPDPFFVELAAKVLRAREAAAVHLRRRRGSFSGRGRACRACTEDRSAGRHDGERQGIDRRALAATLSAWSARTAVRPRRAQWSMPPTSSSSSAAARARSPPSAGVIPRRAARRSSISTWTRSSREGTTGSTCRSSPMPGSRSQPCMTRWTGAQGDLSFVEARKREKWQAFASLAASSDTPIKPERVVAALDRLLAGRRDRRRRSRHPVPVLLGVLPCERHRAALLFQPRPRRARLFARRRGGRAHRPPLGEDRGGHGRRQLRHVRGRARDRGARRSFRSPSSCSRTPSTAGSRPGRRRATGERYFSVDFGVTDHAKVAEAFGVRAFRVVDPRKVEGSLEEALAHGGPTLVDIVCQPLHEARAPVSEWVA